MGADHEGQVVSAPTGRNLSMISKLSVGSEGSGESGYQIFQGLLIGN